MSPNVKSQVRAFWESEACGERYGARQDQARYRFEPEIISFADFPSAQGKRLLEVGVGIGADFVRFLRAGAVATGVDLTDRAIEITRRRVRDEGLTAHLQVADAESLPFGDQSFDLVYSWGVLHHTPNTDVAIAECRRVLAPGGELRLMLYHRHSWLALGAWLRHCGLRLRWHSTLRDAVANIESPGTQAFTRSEAHRLLSGMRDIQVQPHLTHWDRRLAPVVSHLFGNRFGWFLLIRARK